MNDRYCYDCGDETPAEYIIAYGPDSGATLCGLHADNPTDGPNVLSLDFED